MEELLLARVLSMRGDHDSIDRQQWVVISSPGPARFQIVWEQSRADPLMLSEACAWAQAAYGVRGKDVVVVHFPGPWWEGRWDLGRYVRHETSIGGERG